MCSRRADDFCERSPVSAGDRSDLRVYTLIDIPRKFLYIRKMARKADERKPDLNEDWFAEADAFIGTKLVRRGRPKAEKVKRAVSLRLDEDVIDWFKKGGPGWQTRMNEVLRKAARV